MLGFLTALLLRGNKSKRAAAIQAGKYMVGGAIYFWVGYAIFAICYSGLDWGWLPSKILGDIVGWTLNYLVQRYWTFAEHAHLSEMEHAGRYIFIESIGFVMDYGIIWGLTAIGITPYIGFFISAAFFSVWSFLWYKYWVFPEKKPVLETEAA
ncbi:MAG TPA: GtrA family protein [Candidatus Microsaccharimonas sp.]|nr:GtrA family protein [Candidatus Microsaccharimonas sp.]